MFNFLFNKFKSTKNKYINETNITEIGIDSINNDEIEIEKNICSSDLSTCMHYDMNSKKCERDYVEDFINYKLYSTIKSSFDIIINNDWSNIYKCNTKTYCNELLKHYYFEYDKKFTLSEKSGSLEFIVKKNDVVLATIKFNYKLNKPTFNNDIIKISFKKHILFLFVKRYNDQEYFFIYNMIYTNKI